MFSNLSLSLIKRRFNNKIHEIYWSYLLNRYRPRIRKLKNKHQGKKCFIIGTGPSLNKTNFDLIKNEILFGVNTLYRGFSKFGIKCQYYACSDEKAWEAHFKNILNLDTVLFLSSGAEKKYSSKKDFFQKFQKKEPILIKEIGSMVERNKFPKDVSRGVYWGGTVVIDVCLPMAYYMGFKKVYLLGCDCDYSGRHRFDGLKSETLGLGAIGEWERVFSGYEICKKAFEEDGREIINATVGGKLEIFKRQKIEDIIRE